MINITEAYLVLLVLSAGIGLYLTATEISRRYRAVCIDAGEDLFQDTGITVSLKQYRFIRNMMLIIFTTSATVLFAAGSQRQGFAMLLVTGIFFLLSYPGRIKGMETPFEKALRNMKNTFQGQKDNELEEVITQLKNIIVAQQNHPWGMDYMMESVMSFTKYSRPIFAHTLYLMRIGREDEAVQYFQKEFGSALGNQFAAIGLKMDYLQPKEFLDQLDMLQVQIREQQRTRKKKKQETSSVFMFALASVEVLLITMNFVMLIMRTVGQLSL